MFLVGISEVMFDEVGFDEGFDEVFHEIAFDPGFDKHERPFRSAGTLSCAVVCPTSCSTESPSRSPTVPEEPGQHSTGRSSHTPARLDSISASLVEVGGDSSEEEVNDAAPHLVSSSKRGSNIPPRALQHKPSTLKWDLICLKKSTLRETSPEVAAMFPPDTSFFGSMDTTLMRVSNWRSKQPGIVPKTVCFLHSKSKFRLQ